MAEVLYDRLEIQPDAATLVLLFFSYSYMGYIVECVVLTAENKVLIINRGFAKHMPFCVIYGFGCLIGYLLLMPLRENLILLFLVGAVGASALEYTTARIQTHIFGDFWWDYTEKPFNYKGILCLESTLGWGIAAVVVVRFLYKNVAFAVGSIPRPIAMPIALILITAYVVDFVISARYARRSIPTDSAEEEEAVRIEKIKK